MNCACSQATPVPILSFLGQSRISPTALSERSHVGVTPEIKWVSICAEHLPPVPEIPEWKPVEQAEAGIDPPHLTQAFLE